MMSVERDISVVIPFYNREKFIEETIQSVRAQTLQPLEVIIVNDRSRESSRRFLDRYEGECKILDLPVNVGLPGARNAGIQAARGQFIAFLDDDDIWLPQKLELQRQYLEEHPDCSMVGCNVWIFYSDKPDELVKFIRWRPMTLAMALTHEVWIPMQSLLARVEAIQAIGGFDARFRNNEDRDFLIRTTTAGHRIEGIPEPLLRLRRENHDRITRHYVRMFLYHAKVCWVHRALYYRVYGVRGLVSFLLQSLHIACMETRYIDGAVRFLCRVIKIKWKVKPGYSEPVPCDG